MNIKSGYRTTEFWLVVGTNLIPMLMAFGLFQGQDATALTDTYREGVTQFAGVITAGLYIISRAWVKKSGNGTA